MIHLVLDRDSKPKGNIKLFNSVMICHNHYDHLMSKMFVMTQYCIPQYWFHTLSPMSINNFKELSLIFYQRIFPKQNYN